MADERKASGEATGFRLQERLQASDFRLQVQKKKPVLAKLLLFLPFLKPEV